MIRKILLRLIVFLVVFGGGVFYFNYTSIAGKTEMTAEMNQATLPVLYLKIGEEVINELHGYTGDMDEALLKDTLTPVETSKSVTVFVKEYDNHITSLEYDLQNIAGNRSVQKGKITEVKKTKNGVLVTIKWKKHLEEKKDYTLKLTVKADGGSPAHYYTRVRYEKKSHVKDYVKFVHFFHNATLDKGKAEKLTEYMETKPDGVNNSLHAVNLSSNLESLTFAGLNPKQEGKMVISIQDMDQDTATLNTYYVISAENQKKQKEYYYVTEYYYLKYREDKVYVLDFERRQEAYFNPNLIDKNKNAFKLGIGSKDENELLTTSDFMKVALVRQRQLWYYDYKSVHMIKVFSFRQDEKIEARNDYNQHNIKLIRMEEDGSLYFAVYGYMNRGSHEGNCGIVLYRFDASQETIEEILFVPTKETYAVLKEEVDQVLYYNKHNQFFFLLEGTMYQVDCETKEKTVVAKRVTETSVVASDSGRLLSIQNSSNGAKNQKLIWWDLEKNDKTALKVGNDKRIKNIGFVGENLLYGVAKASDIKEKNSSDGLFPMYVIKMFDENKKESNTYQKKNCYVYKAEIDGQTLQLYRVKKKKNGYREIESDLMIRKEEAHQGGLTYTMAYSGERYNQWYLVFPNTIYITTEPNITVTREVLFDDYRTVTIATKSTGTMKYYVNGQSTNGYAKVGDAIKVAAEKNGDVLSSNQQFVWQWGETPLYGGFASKIDTIQARNVKDSKNACMAMVLQYEGIQAKYTDLVLANESMEVMLQRYLGKRSLNVSGATLEQALYYVGKNAPVIAKIKENYYVVITSYNSTHIRYTDPVKGMSIKEDREKMEKICSEKVFYSYLKE